MNTCINSLYELILLPHLFLFSYFRKLSLIMNESGTIMDDTVITNAGDYVYMVVNGACKAKDMAHFKKYMEMVDLDVQMEYMETQQLLALQVRV